MIDGPGAFRGWWSRMPETETTPTSTASIEGNDAIRCIGILGHVGKPGMPEHVAALRKQLGARGIKVCLEQDLVRELTKMGHCTADEQGYDLSALNKVSDRLAVLGGDGTILNFFRKLPTAEEPKPIVGVNLGRLGFLTSVARSNIEGAADLLLEPTLKNYQPRTMLSVRITPGNADSPEEVFTALNEVTFTRGIIPRLVELECVVDGELVSTFNADGLIVATPTGSTAYALAVGGPILTPSLPVFVIAPICPHVLTNRPLVVDHKSVILVRLRQSPIKETLEVYVTVDGGAPRQITSEDQVEITLAPWQARLAMPTETSFFQILREKLKWSGSAV